LLFRYHLQLLYTRFKFYIFLMEMSTGVASCCVLGFIYYWEMGIVYAALCYFGSVLTPVWNVDFLEIIIRFSVMLCRPGSVLCVSSWCTCLRLIAIQAHYISQHKNLKSKVMKFCANIYFSRQCLKQNKL
jgi:hypothetical protein